MTESGAVGAGALASPFDEDMMVNLDFIPVWGFFASSLLLVAIAFEVGHRLGHPGGRRETGHEKESPVSAMSAAILGLAGFMLVFTFGIVMDRFETRKALVREEADAIRTSWLRSDFLPEPDRGEAQSMLRRYADLRASAATSRDMKVLREALVESDRIHRRLWSAAVVNANREINSEVAALYVESLNQLMNMNAQRVAIALHGRIPPGIWLVLYVLIALGMVSIGYQTAIAESTRRTWVMPILAFSFALVIALIASLDRPTSGFITVPQQPLTDVQAEMAVSR